MPDDNKYEALREEDQRFGNGEGQPKNTIGSAKKAHFERSLAHQPEKQKKRR